MDTININVFSTIGSTFCVEAKDGDKLYELIKKSIETKKESRTLIFELITTAFLNSAIGKLYQDFNEDDLKQSITVKDISQSGAIALKRVVETAKLFFKYPETLQNSINEILGD